MVDLKMVTTNFDSSFRRLLASTTETNISPEFSRVPHLCSHLAITMI